MCRKFVLSLVAISVVVAGCRTEAPSVIESPEDGVAEEVVAAFVAAYAEVVGVGEPPPVSIVSDSWKRIVDPRIAEEVQRYAEVRGVSIECSISEAIGFVCPETNPWVFNFHSDEYDRPGTVEVSIYENDDLQHALMFAVEVTQENAEWRVGKPRHIGYSSY